MSLQLKESDEMLKNGFLSLKIPTDIATLLDVPYKTLKYYLYIRPSHIRYSSFKISKKNGNHRLILSPNRSLKIIQSKLHQLLQTVYKPKSPAHGFIRGKSIVTNAKKHTGQRHVLNIDLKDFFPSINYGRVRGMFMAKPYCLPKKVATVLAQICCHDNQLPQGAPTSPIISNMICAKLDSELLSLSRKNGCIYTRYADDITISTGKYRFPGNLAQIVLGENGHHVGLSHELSDIITGNGFTVNLDKVRLLTNNRRQEVTGLVVNNKVNINRKYINQIRAMIHALNKYGESLSENEFKIKYDKKYRPNGNVNLSFVNVLRGKIEFIGMVKGNDNPTYIYYRNKLAKLKPELISELEFIHIVDKSGSFTTSAIILTEGKTDWMHLKTALNAQKSHGNFVSLNIQFHEEEGDMGDDTLLKMCRLYAKTKQKQLTIFMFDRDKQTIIENATEKGLEYKYWGNNVYSFVIPVPKHRIDNPNISIEFYYTDEEIMTSEDNGRRLYINTEFNEKSCRHNYLDLNCTDDKARKSNKCIIDSNVFNADNSNVALSKADFAFNISHSIKPFDQFSFNSFSEIFNLISEILAQHQPQQPEK